VQPGPYVPPPSPATVSGQVFNTSMGAGMSGVELILTGGNNQGQNVTMTTNTDGNGNYKFTGLLPGTYTITQIVPPNLIDQFTNVGAVNGSTDGSVFGNGQIGNISLGSGNNGLNYNFGDGFAGS
jgi:hypothetical protein